MRSAIHMRAAAAGLRPRGDGGRGLASLAKEYDVVIAGGGVIGASVAYHTKLANPALKICVVERDASYKAASATLSAGGMRQQFSVATNIHMSKYGVEFLRNVSTLLEVPGQDTIDVQFKENGYLLLASEAGESTLRANVDTQRAAGVDWTTLLTPGELEARFPWINTEDVTLGCFGEHSEGWFDPWALLVALSAKGKDMGVDFVYGSVAGLGVDTDVSGETQISSVEVRLKDGTTRVIGAGTVVNAAGPFAANIVRMAGEGIADLPVRARKRCLFNFEVRNEISDVQQSPSATAPLVVDPSGVYFRPEGGQGRFIAGVSPKHGEFPDPDCGSVEELERIDHELFEDVIWPALYARCEGFGSLKLKGSWAGFYEFNTLDHNAIIGPHPQISNLILCNGFSGHGLMHSPGAGRAVSELLTEGKFTTIDVSCFSFDRVTRNEPLLEKNVI